MTINSPLLVASLGQTITLLVMSNDKDDISHGTSIGIGFDKAVAWQTGKDAVASDIYTLVVADG